ncbi:MAG: beta-ketoacyl-ACP synthase II [Candidatus Omnitrophota bacterium]|nr:MAG: beta-ketoacyl-ACP synthase II [Candidatus Omnitrophota bacterium]
MKRRVVVTGCGIVSPVGIGEHLFWDSLLNARSGIGNITHFDASKFDSQIAGEVKDFLPPAFLSVKDVRKTARFVQFALAAADQALGGSGLDIEKEDPYRLGVIIGSGIGSLETVEREYRNLTEKGPKKISPFLIPRLITNEAAGLVAIQFSLKGINFCTVTACASGAHAIGEAYRAIENSKADMMVCGGTEAAIVPLGVGGFCSLKALSTRNNEPQRASRPFDRDREGFVMAEGAAVVVLEELEHAKRRGSRIYAELCGYGATCDAYHITAPHPEGESAAKAMGLALKEGGFGIEEKGYINAHGTSTKLNDSMETRAIRKVFGSHAKDVNVSSTKSMMGHTLGAAGAIEFVVCCLTVKNKVIPPTINYENPDPECDLNYTPNKAVTAPLLKYALSNSLGFGGHNASLLVKEFR